jgi:hypothetical protein
MPIPSGVNNSGALEVVLRAFSLSYNSMSTFIQIVCRKGNILISKNYFKETTQPILF